jgi:hypothetical protein
MVNAWMVSRGSICSGVWVCVMGGGSHTRCFSLVSSRTDSFSLRLDSISFVSVATVAWLTSFCKSSSRRAPAALAAASARFEVAVCRALAVQWVNASRRQNHAEDLVEWGTGQSGEGRSAFMERYQPVHAAASRARPPPPRARLDAAQRRRAWLLCRQSSLRLSAV